MPAIRFVLGCFVLALAACGGGISLGFGTGFDDFPPAVSLAAAVTSVQAGQSVRFVAAATDDDGIESVAFYRIDNDDNELLGSDIHDPYEITITAPTDGRTTLSVFARASDNDGNQTDSAIVTIAVTP